ncbi:DUF6886 family protein [Paenibacillus solisilvae]|uniref:DUF6886 family protein n=1 Tax=Paenibacillus solisilvae TaxID=2486751 RepID=A0ABW0W5B7_9BACL
MKLFHFSEDPSIAIFEPRQLEYRLNEPAMVWAVDEFHAPHYFLPRDCPRVCVWPQESTTEEDRRQFFGHSKTDHLIAVEAGWLKRIGTAHIYRYTFNPENFDLYDTNAGYYTSTQTVKPISIDRIDDLISAITSLGIEFRITPSLLPLRDSILASTVNFSMIRMKFANQA